MRHPDWQSRLIRYLAEQAPKPYKPGSHDCALFVAGAVEAMTGENLALRYTTHVKGLAKLRKAGHDDLPSYVAAHFEEVPPAFAQAGDIAVIETEEGPALGLVQGAGIYAFHPVSQGLTIIPLRSAARAFRV